MLVRLDAIPDCHYPGYVPCSTWFLKYGAVLEQSILSWFWSQDWCSGGDNELVHTWCLSFGITNRVCWFLLLVFVSNRMSTLFDTNQIPDKYRIQPWYLHHSLGELVLYSIEDEIFIPSFSLLKVYGCWYACRLVPCLLNYFSFSLWAP